jgi:hypothetical protein
MNWPADAHALPPADGGPVVVLLCTLGMEAFLANALQGMLRVGLDPTHVLIACPPNAEHAVRRIASGHDRRIAVAADPSLLVAAEPQYSDYGSPSFNAICWGKATLIRRLLERYDHVVYADLDIGWIRNPLPYLAQAAGQYGIAMPTEGLPRFPPAVCCGFMSLRRSERTLAFMDALLAQERVREDGHSIDDQTACQRMIQRDPAWLNDIYLLPETLFANGLGYRNLEDSASAPAPMQDELRPFVFHANWTIGLDNKRKLLAAAGCWSGDDAAETEAPAADGAPLVTVIFPLHEVRGDVAEHLSYWSTRQQNVAPERFRLIVAANADTPFDEAALQPAMRPGDILIKVPRGHEDTVLWNAGARAATTPWLLFVEGHGMADSDALAALVAWVAANPHERVCTLRIRHGDEHRVARVMSRWFAEMQVAWSAPSTWRRLHRTAFAFRRDTFERLGPIEPFSQFGPPLLSARIHHGNVGIATLPASGVLHADTNLTSYTIDTIDYVEGELAARQASTDPEFFENHFGPSPVHGKDPILPPAAARSLIRGYLAVAMRQKSGSGELRRKAAALLGAASVNLRLRAACAAALVRLDHFALRRLPLSADLAWSRFMASHRRLVRATQARWVADNPLPPVVASQRIRALALTQHAIVGLHALEYDHGAAFRWTFPAVLLRVAAGRKATLSLETRNLRPGLAAAHLDAVAIGGNRPDIDIDGSGTIVLRAETPSTTTGIADIVLIVPELVEPASGGEPGRRLGLPLFAVTVEIA